MNRVVCAFIAFCLMVFYSFGQSPTTLVDVDKYTGKLSLNIPLTAVSSKHLVVDVGMTYTGGGGIKHQEYSSILGLGWQLTGVGSITRVVRGYPDEFPNGYIGTGQHGLVIKNLLKSLPGINQFILPEGYVKYYDYVSGGFKDCIYDSEPDQYYVSTPTFSFEFTLDEHGDVVVSNTNGVKIVHYNLSNTSLYANSKFEVTDELGNKYFFGTNNNFKSFARKRFPNDEVMEYTSTWHLEKIISINDPNDYIQFTYEDLNRTDYYASYFDYNRVKQQFPGETAIVRETVSFLETRDKVLKSIQSSSSQTVDFFYVTDRKDICARKTVYSEADAHYEYIASLPRLTSITNSYANQQLDIFSFSSSYFGSISSSDAKQRSKECRLRLDSIVKNDEIYKKMEYESNYRYLYDRSLDVTDYFGFWTDFRNKDRVLYDPMDEPIARGFYNESFTANGILTYVQENLGNSFSVTYELNSVKALSSNSTQKFAGLRVSKIEFHENKERLSPITKEYQYEFDGLSTGERFHEYFDCLTISLNTNLGLNTSVTFKSSPSVLYDKSGNHMGYKKVREILPDQAYIDYTFQSNYDFSDRGTPIQIGQGLNEVIVPVTTSSGHKRGLLKKIESFDKEGRLLNMHESFYAEQTFAQLKSFGVVYDEYIVAAVGNSPVKRASKGYYWTPIDDYRLIKTVSKAYDDKDSVIENITHYGYHENKYLIKNIKKNGSEGNVYTTTMYYPEDGGNIPLVQQSEVEILNDMVAANIKGAVVQEVIERNVVGAPVLRICNEYDYPFKIKESATYKEFSAQEKALVSFTRNYYNTDNLLSMSTLNGKNYKSLAYDDMGNVSVQINNACSQMLDGTTSNMYYEFYYEGFEHTPPIYGTTNTYAGLGAAPTPFEVPFVKENDRSYLIDYRYYESSTGRWKYKKARYSDNFVIDDGTHVDEIRVYPEDAEINTYTYNKIRLKTSETSTNGITTFYKYDEKRRVSRILDQDKNVLESYDYNKATALYTNDHRFQYFTKNNCLGNYILGAEVPYSVPKGKYFSRISKADANAQADAEIAANGQLYANTVGNCGNSVYVKFSIINHSINYVEGTSEGDDEVVAEYRGDLAVSFYLDADMKRKVDVTNKSLFIWISLDPQIESLPVGDNPYMHECSGMQEVVVENIPLRLEYAQKVEGGSEYRVITATNYLHSLINNPGYIIIP